jgi:hypothetical protein
MPSQRNLTVCPTLQTRGGDIERSCSRPKWVFCSIHIEDLKQNSYCDVIHRKDSRFHFEFASRDFLNGQGCRSGGSTDVLSSYLRYAGGLTCPVDMKGDLE